MKKTYISILMLTLGALYSVTPLLIRPEFIDGSHWDLGNYMSWTQQVGMAIREGVFYPRWQSFSNGGYGSPTTVFYSPLFYWLTGFINLFIPSLIVSLKVTTIAGFFISGLSMYMFLRNFCGHTGSVAGGILYQLLPYHIFDLYIRSSLPETFAFLWLPLIMHFIYKGFTENKVDKWIGLSFSYAGLILTHIVSAYIFTFVAAFYALALTLREKDIRRAQKFILATLFGLSISAVYFIPMLFERKFVHLKWITDRWDYRHRFLFMNNEYTASPFYIQLEVIAVLLVLLVFFSLIIYLLRRGSYSPAASFGFVFFFCLFAFSLFLSIPLSAPVWTVIPGLPTIHLPWRWLMVSVFAAAVLTGLSLDAIPPKAVKAAISVDRITRVSVAMFHALIIGNIIASFYIIIGTGPLKEKDLERLLGEGGGVIAFRPIWVPQKAKDFSEERGNPPVVFKEGTGKIDINSWKSHSRLFTVNAAAPSIVRVSTFYYPGWTALMDGREIPIDIEKDSGAMLLTIPPGKNEVLLEFRDTSLRKVAKWISIISFLAAILVLVAARQRK